MRGCSPAAETEVRNPFEHRDAQHNDFHLFARPLPEFDAVTADAIPAIRAYT